MKLFLASEGKNPQTLERLEQFTGGLKDKKIVYIPTAANGEFYGSWKGGGSIQVAKDLGAQIIELEDALFKDIFTPIKSADILWIAGGMSGYLLYWIRRVELDKLLPELLDKGTIYVGSSAGSMIAAPTQYSAEWFFMEPEPGADLIPGLGLVDFEIYPHFTDDIYNKVSERWQKGTLYCLKDGDVITKVGNKIEVLGEEIIINK